MDEFAQLEKQREREEDEREEDEREEEMRRKKEESARGEQKPDEVNPCAITSPELKLLFRTAKRWIGKNRKSSAKTASKSSIHLYSKTLGHFVESRDPVY